MIKLRLTETSNIILALLGIGFSFGFFINQASPFALFIFAGVSIIYFLYRTKFQAINYIAIAINFLVYLFTFGYYNSLFFGVYINQNVMFGLAVLTSIMFIVNAVLNYLTMTGKLKNAKEEK